MAEPNRCASCEVPLPAAAGRCPSCGHVFHEPVVVGSTGPGRRPRLRLVVAGIAAATALVSIGLLASDGPRPDDSATEPATGTGTTPRPSTGPTTASTGSPSGVREMALPGSVLAVERLDGAWPDVAEARFLRWARSGPAELLDPGRGVSSQVQLAARGPVAAVVPRLTGAVVVAAGRAVFHSQLPGPAALVELGPAELALPSDLDSAVWLINGAEGGVGASVREVDVVGGGALSASLVLPADVEPVAGVTGGLLVRAPDGGFVVDRDGGIRRVTSGTVLDTSAANALVRACDEALRCTERLVDLRTGTEREVELDASLTVWETHLSPAGTVSATIGHDGQHHWRLVIVDLTTGRRDVHELDTAGFPPPAASVTWSPDGRWLILGRQGGLRFYRPGATGAEIVDRPGSLAAVAVIAAAPVG
jgi:hypothetical protein